MKKSKISKYFSKLAKEGHKKNPRGRDYYVNIARKRWNKQDPLEYNK